MEILTDNVKDTGYLMLINAKELLTILYSLKLRRADGCSSLVNLDNTTILSYIKKLEETTFPKLSGISERIWSHFLKTNTSCDVTYVPSDINPADSLPR
ncbi:hypothetical protein AYI70_g11865 [Smittium culicis]|uniref:Uncharacterized protein n=1 Tax=Smittium culicis TaxID=133412 RepID=A0A1R1X012_9FUNG|nr:hypothetical protein AYI70_g11865 [Smittium culicis]